MRRRALLCSTVGSRRKDGGQLQRADVVDCSIRESAAPDVFRDDPPARIARGDQNPVVLAPYKSCENPRSKRSACSRTSVWAPQKRRLPRNKNVGLTLDGRLMHPAFVAVAVAHLAPMINRFSDHHDRRASLFEQEFHRMIKARTDPAIRLILFQADKARDRIARRRVEPDGVRGLRRRDADAQMG